MRTAFYDMTRRGAFLDIVFEGVTTGVRGNVYNNTAAPVRVRAYAGVITSHLRREGPPEIPIFDSRRRP